MPQKPRLLIAVTLAETGGAQTYAAQLVNGFADRFDVIVAAHGPGPLAEEAAASGVQFIALRHVRRPVSPWRDPLGLAELIRICRRERPQIVHASSSKAGLLALLAARLTGVPVRIFTAHGWAFRWHSGLAAGVYRFLERMTGRLATRIVCVSEAELELGLAAGTCTLAKVVVIHNAVAAPSEPRATRTGRVPTIVSVTRLKEPKDTSTLLRALARLNGTPFRAQIVGDGPGRAAIEAERRRLCLVETVDLLGERRDVPALLAASDVFVLSSRSEACPVSILEAMAAGLPVVASKVGGVPELVVDGETGFLPEPGDDEALASAVARLVADAGLRRRMGDSGRARVAERFDLSSFYRAHAGLYRRELERAGVAP